MASNFPGALDVLTNPASTDRLTTPSHAEQHANANDAIEAIQATLGVNPQGDAASVSARIAALEDGGGGGGGPGVAWGEITGTITDQAEFTTTPTADSVPIAQADGTLNAGWQQGPYIFAPSPAGSGFPYGLPAFVLPGTSTTALSVGANQFIGVVFEAFETVEITSAIINISSAGAAASVGVVALYEGTYDPISGAFTTGDKVADLGTIPLDGATGVRLLTGLTTTIQKGQAYVLGISVSAACTIACFNCQRVNIQWISSGGVARHSIYESANSAYPPPDPGPALSTNLSSAVTTRAPVLVAWGSP